MRSVTSGELCILGGAVVERTTHPQRRRRGSGHAIIEGQGINEPFICDKHGRQTLSQNTVSDKCRRPYPPTTTLIHPPAL